MQSSLEVTVTNNVAPNGGITFSLAGSNNNNVVTNNIAGVYTNWTTGDLFVVAGVYPAPKGLNR